MLSYVPPKKLPSQRKTGVFISKVRLPQHGGIGRILGRMLPVVAPLLMLCPV